MDDEQQQSPGSVEPTVVFPSNGSGHTSGQTLPAASGSNGFPQPSSATNGSTEVDEGPGPIASQSSTYFGHDRNEVTRILIQALADMGYRSAADSVSRASGCKLEGPTVASFRGAIMAGQWEEAERLLTGASLPGENNEDGNGLILAAGSDRTLMRFWIRQQKYLELLELKRTTHALTVLRDELTPIHQDTPKLHFLSGLLMVGSAQDLKGKAHWDGAAGQSRKQLLSELSKCISPAVMLPENRLAVLLEQVKAHQIDSCLYHTEASSPSLYSNHSCDRRRFPAEIALELSDLDGEVWQIQFSHDGTKLAACGDKRVVIIWETQTFTVIQCLGEHDAGVGNLAWSPDDSMMVTCSQDSYARVWDVRTGNLLRKCRKFEEPVAGCVWASDSRSFVIGSLDRNSLCTFSLDNDDVIEWRKRHRVQDLCGSSDGRWLVAVDDVQKLHVYNAMTRDLEYEMEAKARPTSVNVSRDSRYLLVNKRDGEAQLIDLVTRNSVQKFLGHTGGDYLIRSAFGGANESFVVSGSEDGNILIWHKNSGAAVERLPGHQKRCNAVTWNPTDPCMLASCGDDHRVKIWSNKEKSYELRALHPARNANGWSGPSELP